MKIHFNLHVYIRIVVVDPEVGYEKEYLMNPNSVKKDAKTSQRVRDRAEITGYIKNRSYYIGSLENFESLSSRERLGFDYIELKFS